MLSAPQASSFSLFGLNLHYYGLIIASAILCALFAIRFLVKKDEFENVCEILPFMIIFGILGARIYYVLINFNYYSEHLTDILSIWQGGLAIHGAIIGGVLPLIVYTAKHNLRFLVYSDMFALVLPLAQAIGRWGNYFNNEAFGFPCSHSFCLFVPQAFRPEKYQNYAYFHPTFLYESILNLLLFIFFVVIFKKFHNLKSGIITCLYLIFYSLIRIFVEFFRIDATVFVGQIALPVIVSVIILIFSVIFLTFLLKK